MTRLRLYVPAGHGSRPVRVWSCRDAGRVHHQLGGQRQLADAASSRMEDSVGDRGSHADLANLSDTLDPERLDDVVSDLDELKRIAK